MNGKTILIASHDKRGSRRLSACLRGAGNRTLIVDDAKGIAALVAARAVDLVVLDCVDLSAAEGVLGLMSGTVPIVAVAPAGGETALARVFCEYEVDHLVCGSPENDEGLAGVDGGQVVTVVEKLLREDFFGLAKYMPGFGMELHGCVLRRADERDALIRVVSSYLGEVGCSRRQTAKIATLADELVTNAIYNAPRDRDGRPIYAATDRRTKVMLGEGDDVRVEFGSDGEKFAIAVTDPFGSLSVSRLRACVRRCLTSPDPIEQKSGGAGLGLYTVLMSCSQLIINIDPGKRTEVIAIVDLRSGSRAQVRSGHSLHVFYDKKARISDGVPATIILSDSVRTDLAALFTVEPRHAHPAERRRRRASSATLRAPLARRRHATGSNPPRLRPR